VKVVYKEVLYSRLRDSISALDLGKRIEVPMPRGAKIINFLQSPIDETLCMWYECTPGEPMESRFFWLAFTGSHYPAELQAIASAALMPRKLWVHLLEEVLT